jgi:hypothetical protein
VVSLCSRLPFTVLYSLSGNFTGGCESHNNRYIGCQYLNFSAFLARLLAGGVIETTRLSALVSPSPFGEGNIADTKPYIDSLDAVRRYKRYAPQAVQWILHAGGALFEMCEKDVTVEIGAQRWNHELWESWKAKFKAVSVDNRLGCTIPRLARRARVEMIRLESQVVPFQGGIVEKFGFIVLGDSGA